MNRTATATVRRLCLIAALSASPVFAAPSTYTVTNLSLGGAHGLYGVIRINGVGQVAGASYLADMYTQHAFFFDGTNLVDLGTFGGTNSYASALNDSGQVVGGANNSADRFLPFSWTSAGGLQNLAPGAHSGGARAVNNSGQVVGAFSLDGSQTRAFSWTSASGLVPLGTLGGTFSLAGAVNAAGMVLGVSSLPGVINQEPFLWTAEGGMKSLGNLGGRFTEAGCLNDAGQVAGNGRLPSNQDASFFWSSDSGMTQIAPTLLWSNVRGMNAAGQVVGWGYSASTGTKVGYSWTASGGFIPLSLGGTSAETITVNSGGQVVGCGLTSSGAQHAFVWSQSTGMIDLGALLPSASWSCADQINDAGVVAGSFYQASTGQYHSFVWTTADGVHDLNDLTPNKPAGMVIGVAVALGKDGQIVARTDSGLVFLRPVPPSTSAPVIGPIGANDPSAVSTAINVTASFSDSDTVDTHTAQWNWGDGSAPQAAAVVESGGAGTVTGSHAYTGAGIYTVSLTVTDSTGRSTVASSTVVVYDPSAGFVTGAGWINSPMGAYKQDARLAGRATFGFVSKYQKGTTVPTGNTEFQFHAASLNFRSDAYDWLVVAGARAQYKGIGTINGAGSYKFRLTAVDGDRLGSKPTDRFRINIWYYDTTQKRDVVVYDNQIDSSTVGTNDEGTAIGGGSIVIHAN